MARFCPDEILAWEDGALQICPAERRDPSALLDRSRLMLVTIHAIPDDVIEHDHSDDCLCGPTQALAWFNGREFWIAYHQPLLESTGLERWSC